MKKTLVSLLAFLFITAFPQRVFAAYNTAENSGILTGNATIQPGNYDTEFLSLYSFLKKQNSPLADYAYDFVAAAKTWKLDWSLLPAISGLESSFGKIIPYQSFNAYGWANGKYVFENWSQSIHYVAYKIRIIYVEKGLKTPQQMAKIYAPPSQIWGKTVAYLKAEIENFSSPSDLVLIFEL